MGRKYLSFVGVSKTQILSALLPKSVTTLDFRLLHRQLYFLPRQTHYFTASHFIWAEERKWHYEALFSLEFNVKDIAH
jgi:hypothetical protein